MSVSLGFFFVCWVDVMNKAHPANYIFEFSKKQDIEIKKKKKQNKMFCLNWLPLFIETIVGKPYASGIVDIRTKKGNERSRRITLCSSGSFVDSFFLYISLTELCALKMFILSEYDFLLLLLLLLFFCRSVPFIKSESILRATGNVFLRVHNLFQAYNKHVLMPFHCNAD